MTVPGPADTICSLRNPSSRSPFSVTTSGKYVNMADINFPAVDGAPPAPAGDRAARDPDVVWDIIELLFFAYRDFVSDPDDALAKFNFGRAHHRVLHFVNRNPGIDRKSVV